VRRLRQATLHEVIAAWLQAEAASPRFGHHLRLTDVDRRIIERPDLNDPAENSLRRQLLRYRDDILTTIPDDTGWWAAELSADDLFGLLAINYPAWEIYSGGTGRLLHVAEAVRDGARPASDDALIQDGLVAIRENVEGICRALEAGRPPGPLILLGRRAEGPFTVIEGNKRAAALCRRHLVDVVPCQGVTGFVGVTTGPNPWLSPHATPSPM
jgi:hypothetical protein